MVDLSVLTWLNRFLYAVQAALVLGVCYVVFVAISGLELQDTRVHQPTEPAAVAPSPQALRPLAWYAPLWQRDFRQEPIAKAGAVAQASPPPELPKLLGTFLEQDQVYAQLLTPDGSAKVYAPGQIVDRYELVAVEGQRICLRRDGDDYWIELPLARPDH